MSAAFSPTMIEGAFVLELSMVGQKDESTARRRTIPFTRSGGSTTTNASLPAFSGRSCRIK